MCEKLQMKNVLAKLRGHIAELGPKKQLHYKICCNEDGVNIFNNSEQAEAIPILVYVHSISKSAAPEDVANEIILKTRLPFVVGYYHGKTKPSVEELTKDFVAELLRLHPDNDEPETEGRRCICELFCMTCDSPMR